MQNRALRDKLKPVAWGMQTTLDDASHVVIILAKKHARYDSAFFDAIVKKRSSNDTEAQRIYQRYRDFQTNDLRIADDERALFDWACKQTYIALANMMTGAAMLGIDSCAIEGMHYDSVNRILSEEGLLDTEGLWCVCRRYVRLPRPRYCRKTAPPTGRDRALGGINAARITTL